MQCCVCHVECYHCRAETNPCGAAAHPAVCSISDLWLHASLGCVAWRTSSCSTMLFKVPRGAIAAVSNG